MGKGSTSDNKIHEAALIVAESTRQGAANTQVGQKAADIAFFRTARASAVANGLSPTPFVLALMELGTGGV